MPTSKTRKYHDETRARASFVEMIKKRINRRLGKEGFELRISRTAQDRERFGDYYIIATHIDLSGMADQLDLPMTPVEEHKLLMIG